jgi:hypothetical protein
MSVNERNGKFSVMSRFAPLEHDVMIAIMLLGDKLFELQRTDRLACHTHFSSSSLRSQGRRRGLRMMAVPTITSCSNDHVHAGAAMTPRASNASRGGLSDAD